MPEIGTIWKTKQGNDIAVVVGYKHNLIKVYDTNLVDDLSVPIYHCPIRAFYDFYEEA
jgi:hypothetical protein